MGMLRCETCGGYNCEPCEDCGGVVHIGAYPFCPHGFTSQRSGFESFTDDVNFEQSTEVHSAHDFDRALRRNHGDWVVTGTRNKDIIERHREKVDRLRRSQC